MTTTDIDAFNQMMARDTTLIQQEDALMAEALEYGRMQQAALMLNLELGVPRRATPEVALAIYRYAQKHGVVPEFSVETVKAAQQERNITH